MRFPILPDSGPEAADYSTLRYDVATKRWVPGPVVDPAEVAAMDTVLADFQAGMDATDTGVASVITDRATATAQALAEATIDPSVMSMVAGVLGRNSATTPLPQMVPLITGNPDETVAAFAFQTVTNVPSPTNPRSTVWKVEGSGSTNLRLDRALGGINAAPANAITAWVYLPEPEKINYLYVALICADGSWVRQSNQALSSTDGKPLRRGWNALRMPAHASAPSYAYLNQINTVSVRAYYSAGTSMMVGPVVVEQRPRASIVLINDWGSKPFYDNAYPDCKAAGIPVTWALRVGILGTGTYPNNHISLNEALTVAGENGNSVSFHSWDGSANSASTPAEVLAVIRKAQAGLSVRGLFGEGAVHRPAWVQNVAPNAPAADSRFVTAGTYADNVAVTAWPPTFRLNIPRIPIHGRTNAALDAEFALLEQTREAALYYTHGVVPAGQEGTNHATQERWDWFFAKVQAAVAAGWLECVTIPQLVARERLVMPTEPPV